MKKLLHYVQLFVLLPLNTTFGEPRLKFSSIFVWPKKKKKLYKKKYLFTHDLFNRNYYELTYDEFRVKISNTPTRPKYFYPSHINRISTKKTRIHLKCLWILNNSKSSQYFSCILRTPILIFRENFRPLLIILTE